jgi:hypothetical protein
VSLSLLTFLHYLALLSSRGDRQDRIDHCVNTSPDLSHINLTLLHVYPQINFSTLLYRSSTPPLSQPVLLARLTLLPLTRSIGPAFAIPAVLTKAGITKDDVDFYEINEAFASQAVMSIQHLHLPYEKVNPVGGAIALGHPLGCTGARQVATALSEAKREKKKVFVTSMCIGSGMVSDFPVLVYRARRNTDV